MTILVDLTCLRTASRVRGIGRYTVELTTALSAASPASDGLRLVYLEDLSWTGAALTTEDLDAALARLLDPGRKEWSQSTRHKRLSRGFERVVRKHRPRILHLPESNWVPPRFPEVLRLITCFDLIPLRFPEQYLDGEAHRRDAFAEEERKYGTADHVVCISDATARDLKQILQIDGDKSTTVYPGVDSAKWRMSSLERPGQVLSPLGVDGDYFLYVGDGDYRKNADGMCAALKQLERLGHRVPLVWAGRLSKQRETRARGFAREHGVQLVFTDYVDDQTLGALYQHARAMIFVSRFEGFGYPVLEAMGHGCPVITSNVSSLPEVTGDAGQQVDPEDPEAIAGAMRRILTDPQLALDLAERGRDRLRLFSPRRQGEATLALYRRLLAKGSRTAQPLESAVGVSTT